MTGRRRRQDPKSTRRAPVETLSQGKAGVPVSLAQDADAQSAGDPQALRGTDIAAVLAVADVDQQEPAKPIATALLETVSTSTIQLHPAEPTKRSPPTREKNAGKSSRETAAPQPASLRDVAAANSEPPHTKPAPVSEDRNAGAQDIAIPAASAPAVVLHDGGSPYQAQQAGTDTSSPGPVDAAVSDRGGRAEPQTEALGSPFALARAAVEANAAVWGYLRKEGAAALAHMQALSSAKSPADIIDLQAREASRALDAAQSIGQELADAAGKLASKTSRQTKDKAQV